MICKTAQNAEALASALARKTATKTALFHEGLSLIQRDRNAAWFAEKEGARLLICSEILTRWYEATGLFSFCTPSLALLGGALLPEVKTLMEKTAQKDAMDKKSP